MIIRTPEDLPNFEPKQLLCVDLETTSFDDAQLPLKPFSGHRTAGYAISTPDHKSWYLPLRHRTGDNFNLDNGLNWVRDIMGSGRDIVNHNILFDAGFWKHDKVEVKGQLLDTMALARLVYSDQKSLTLDALTGGGKDARVKAYLKKHKSKDYGACPVGIMGPYAENDSVITMKLYQKLMHDLRSESNDVWEVERRLTTHFQHIRHRGIRVDWYALKVRWRNSLRRMMELQDKIDEINEGPIDLGREVELTDLLVHRLGIKPLGYTPKTHKPQWTQIAFEQIKHPVGKLLWEYANLDYFVNNYCEGWHKRKGDDDRLHPQYKLFGATTGRMSCVDPNFNNLNEIAEMFVLPEEGHAILGYDYSQIEYRLFAHYANDKNIIQKYIEDPRTDYHGALAEILGVDRQFAKSLNFAFLYGMGKTKLLQMIAGICAINASDENMQEKLRTFLTGAAKQSADRAKMLDLDAYKNIALNIYDNYHKKVPSIRILKSRVENACGSRGWLRNIKGRIYQTPPNVVYKAVNLLIQGSAADVFKERLLHMLDTFSDQHLIANVYDSGFFSVPLEILEERATGIKAAAEVFEYRVPLTIEMKVSSKCWGTCVKFDNPFEIKAALQKSEDVSKRSWGNQHEILARHLHGKYIWHTVCCKRCARK